ncbi:ATP synthase F1 subunit epsilon [Tanticharoenia sakaeratensis]|uniref:ATP synthase epsilon chain n=1 Tax=Tanticharoenia sakaeratensis NBRC 103193 TaxID=1231623 RepID=A0A0D6MLF3_9PROT|nr:ATP synthase F1 subunit epsilon [Tanticharoenia sakaeratensis]GAN54514.1 ATP synthase epsilon chain [Tanticharoenia sakaeratensis NBRC 103193]GBQ23830.1 ATP synthase F1 subunit epsilon [Tanticharoenia sakaeratensis NBRC 103193]
MPLQVEIISPEQVLVRRDADMAVVPGAEGDIAAMPERAPVMLLLRAGVVSLYEGERVAEQYFVEGGFADMTADRCTILADAARPVSDLDANAARGRIEELDNNWSSVDPQNEAALIRAAEALQATQAEIESARS